MTTASAPRGIGPPVAIGVVHAGRDREARRDAAGDRLIVERQRHGRGLARAGQIGGSHREPVDAGAVERRHIDWRGYVFRQHAPERFG